jgi:CRP-like cAMP-binding protein
MRPLEHSMDKALETKRLTGNVLLDALSVEEQACLPVRQVTFSLGQTLYESDEPVSYAYFPTTCVVSCLYTTHTGATAETALVGNDGVLGVALFLADGKSPYRAVAQIGGNALRIPAKAAQAAFAQGGQFQRLLLRYTHALITQISQTAICNRLHSLEQRLCRWLLLCHDRVHGSEFLMTQEFIANMLGGRRESVTVAAGHLQDLGLISYSRGRIIIVNRAGLERIVCECYEAVNTRIGGSAARRVNVPIQSRSEEADGEALSIG